MSQAIQPVNTRMQLLNRYRMQNITDAFFLSKGIYQIIECGPYAPDY